MHRTPDWRRSADKVTLGVGLVPNVGLISSVSHSSEGGSVLSWIQDFVKLLGWGYMLCQVTRSGGHVITLCFKNYMFITLSLLSDLKIETYIKCAIILLSVINIYLSCCFFQNKFLKSFFLFCLNFFWTNGAKQNIKLFQYSIQILTLANLLILLNLRVFKIFKSYNFYSIIGNFI